jgi:hypothetical protein
MKSPRVHRREGCRVISRLACLFAAATLLVAAQPAAADPVTYKGTLGKTAIVVELTDDPATSSGPVAGRYLYRSQGADIPLRAKAHQGRSLQLAEEEACKDKCEEGKPGPVGAVWKLTASADGKTLEGSWVGKKTLAVKLDRAGSRHVAGDAPKSPLDLYNYTDQTFIVDDAEVTSERSPYDYLRFDVPLDTGEKHGWPDASWHDVADPRTKFARPRILELAGGVSPDAANTVLQHRHWRDSLAALECKALQYAGFQENGPIPGVEDDSLGGYEDTTAEVAALTPKLMSWRESGSVFCGGAHPDNFSDAFTMDVRTGQLLGLADMFKDVVDGAPGPSLVAFVKERRKKPSTQEDIDFETECGMDDLISQYLVGSIKREDDGLKLVFGLQGLPHVIQACGDDLMELPVADAKQLLTEKFAALLGK